MTVRKNNYIILVLAACICMLTTGAFAVDANKPAAVAPESNSTVAAGTAPVVQQTADANAAVKPAVADGNSQEAVATPVQMGDGDIQSLTFRKDMTIRSALRLLAAQYHKNIVPSLKVDGPITVTSLYDVSFDEALKAILGKDFAYTTDGGFIKVYTADEYKKIKADTDRMTYKVFTLYYITALEASKLILPVKSEGGMISMTSPAEISISGGASSDTGGGAGATGANTKGGGDTTAIHDTIVMRDFPENIEKADEIIKSVDVRPKQVLIEATIFSAALTEGMEMGVDLNFLSGNGFSTVSDVHSTTGGTPIATTGFAGTQSGNGLKVGVTSGSFTALITALESVTDVTILANPKIMAVNKQEGSMLIGQNLGYRSSTTVGQGGVATEGEVQFLQTGTQLVFRPYIGNDGYIRMEIFPKQANATLNGDGVPTEDTTELRSNILVKDGETIVIGGLFKDNVTSSRGQVPLLGNIPLVGMLFRNTTDSATRSEVIVLLRPHIIDEAGQTGGERLREDVSRSIHATFGSMQWYSRTRIADGHYAKAVELYDKDNLAAALCEVDQSLDVRPTFMEALRLKDKIVSELHPGDAKTTKRIMLDMLERQESPGWIRN